MSSSSKSSGSEGALAMDDKKRKRMESNRESARRSRQRKQSHLGDLVRQVAILQSQNGEFSGKAAEISRSFGAVEAANAVLYAEKERLSRRLESLESVIETAKAGVNVTSTGWFDGGSSCEFSGMVKPWRQTMMMPDTAASISMAASSSSGGMFQ